ncbi:MAG TPA: aldo/keto reductase [Acidimicrobiales bacterium]|nr:aldo/keto reductase [Acidimicrobiales bacterium]
MERRTIGSLEVTAVGLGCNQFGTKACDEATSVRIVNEAIDAGIGFLDTADEYGSNYADPTDPEGWGRSEEILGTVLRTRRDEVVLATKFGARPHGDAGARGGASARWARQAIDESLRRLGTDRVDLYQVHFPDTSVPIDETLGALGELVAAGKVREVGCCNFSAQQLEEARAVAEREGLPRLVSLQAPLNLFQRRALGELVPACERLGMAFVPYYPLASGMLTGKYRRGAVPRSGTRLTDQVDDSVRERLFSERAFDRLEALSAWAAERGHTVLELAIAWLLAQPTVPTVIAGAAKPGQASANAAAGSWRLTPEEAAEVTALMSGSDRSGA